MGKKRQPVKKKGSEKSRTQKDSALRGVDLVSIVTPKLKDLPLVPEGSEFSAIQKELAKQTDRGLAVLGGAYLEWRVRQTIKHRLYRWEVTPTNAEKPRPVGDTVFGTDEQAGKLGFADQCRIAYCLGLVGRIGYCDLIRVAKIRNRFAHHIEVTSFDEDKDVRDLCAELESPNVFDENIRKKLKRFKGSGPNPKPRNKFKKTVDLLWIMLFQVAAYFPVEWPDPEDKCVYW